MSGLSAEQLKRIEENRKKAIALRAAKQTSNVTKSSFKPFAGNPTFKHSNSGQDRSSWVTQPSVRTNVTSYNKQSYNVASSSGCKLTDKNQNYNIYSGGSSIQPHSISSSTVKPVSESYGGNSLFSNGSSKNTTSACGPYSSNVTKTTGASNSVSTNQGDGLFIKPGSTIQTENAFTRTSPVNQNQSTFTTNRNQVAFTGTSLTNKNQNYFSKPSTTVQNQNAFTKLLSAQNQPKVNQNQTKQSPAKASSSFLNPPSGKGLCVLVSRRRFEVQAGYHQGLIEVCKLMESRQYGK